ALQAFYKKLLDAIDAPVFRDGQWALCNRTGWPDNPSYQNVVAWGWFKDNDRYLIIVNLSDTAAQARVQMSWDELRGKTWRLVDALSDATYDRNGDEIRDPGLYVDLRPWNCYFFRLQSLCAGRQGRLEPGDPCDELGQTDNENRRLLSVRRPASKRQAIYKGCQ